MGYSYPQKPHSERGREFKVSPICLRTAVSPHWRDRSILSISPMSTVEECHDLLQQADFESIDINHDD